MDLFIEFDIDHKHTLASLCWPGRSPVHLDGRGRSRGCWMASGHGGLHRADERA